SLLGEGLTGENNRLKRGLKCRTPAIPLRGLRSRGVGDGDRVASHATILVPLRAVPVPHLGGSTHRGACARVLLHDPYHFPLCPGELVDSLSHVVRFRES